MAVVQLPRGGRVVLDTAIVVYAAARHRRYTTALDPVWQAAVSGDVELFASGLLEMEALIGPIRTGGTEERSRVEHILRQMVRLLPIDRPTLLRAAEFRVRYAGLKTGDAIHLAAASTLNADMFLTNDRRLLAVREVPVVYLEGVLAS